MAITMEQRFVAVGERLREERKRLKLKQTDVAYQLGKRTGQSVSNWERGRGVPQVDTLLLMSEMGFDVGFIITGRKCLDKLNGGD